MHKAKTGAELKTVTSTAYYEDGHAVVARVLHVPVSRMTVVPGEDTLSRI
jgi:hypothetical protein